MNSIARKKRQDPMRGNADDTRNIRDNRFNVIAEAS